MGWKNWPSWVKGLLILTIIILVAIIVSILIFLNNGVNMNTSKNDELPGACFQVELTPKVCVLNGSNATVTIQWTGGSEVILQNVNVIVADQKGRSAINRTTISTFLGTTTVNYNLAVQGVDVSNVPLQASAAAVIKTASGTVWTCSVSPLAKVVCA